MSVKLIILGDYGVGKTTFLLTYINDRWPTEFIPTTLRDTECVVNIENFDVNVKILDIVCNRFEDYPYTDSPEMLCAGTSVFFLCFNVSDKSSFEHIESIWMPEIKKYHPNVPVILIGTRSDHIGHPTVIKYLIRNQRIWKPNDGLIWTDDWMNSQKKMLVYGYLKDCINTMSINSVEYIINIISPIIVPYVDNSVLYGKLFVSDMEAQQLCDKLGIMEYQLTSAYQNNNISDSFKQAIKLGMWYNECIKNRNNDYQTMNSIHDRRNSFKKYCENGYTIPNIKKSTKCAIM